MAKKEEEMTFEESLKRLEEIVKDLENGNVPLDDAINKFKEAMDLSKTCNEKLKNGSNYEKEIIINNRIKYFKKCGIDLGNNYSLYLNNEQIGIKTVPSGTSIPMFNVVGSSNPTQLIQVFGSYDTHTYIKNLIYRTLKELSSNYGGD